MITYKILFLGDSSVGKTAFIIRFCDGKFEQDSLTTIGLDKKAKSVSHKDKKILLQIWDTAGQERFRSIAKSCYKGADGILLMYDVNNYDSFKHIKTWIKDIKANITIPWEKLALIVIGNKCDLPNEAKKVDKEDIEEFKKTNNGIQVIEASAKLDINVNESIIALIDKMMELGVGKYTKNDVEERARTFSVENVENNKKKKDCCGGGGKKKENK